MTDGNLEDTAGLVDTRVAQLMQQARDILDQNVASVLIGQPVNTEKAFFEKPTMVSLWFKDGPSDVPQP